MIFHEENCRLELRSARLYPSRPGSVSKTRKEALGDRCPAYGQYRAAFVRACLNRAAWLVPGKFARTWRSTSPISRRGAGDATRAIAKEERSEYKQHTLFTAPHDKDPPHPRLRPS